MSDRPWVKPAIIAQEHYDALKAERDALAGENDRLWRFLADEAPIRELPEWMRDKIYARERAEQEAMASNG